MVTKSPDARAGKRFPHLHIGPVVARSDFLLGNRYLHRMHFPTEIVPLSSVIRMVIEEFGTHPLRDDWHQVLAQEEAF